MSNAFYTRMPLIFRATGKNDALTRELVGSAGRWNRIIVIVRAHFFSKKAWEVFEDKGSEG